MAYALHILSRKKKLVRNKYSLTWFYSGRNKHLCPKHNVIELNDKKIQETTALEICHGPNGPYDLNIL